MPFAKILIANRGEIACRIAATAKRMGIKTVAVVTAADAHSLHGSVADETHTIDDYLNGAGILAVAAHTGADAIHPGCGFLSESPAFAEQCRAAGVAFIGPSAEAMAVAASKATARQLAAQAGIATVPGFDDSAADDAALQAAAEKLGTPLLIKAAAGGGGRGMRVVDDLHDFPAALASARREAKAGFGDDTIILEKYIRHARHLEAQLLADHHGTALVLGERDCSLQRRHQKVVEEAPAPNLSEEVRAQLHATAQNLATAMQYSNAGTVECLLDSDSGQLYFLEVNARLQVEHPVTEMIYQTDLVEWQLRIAAGEPLPKDGWQPQGAAMEARLCAESPLKNFLPESGWGECILPPTEGNIRTDSGVARRAFVAEQYDSLLAKVIAYGNTREEARAALMRALDSTRISGIGNNTAFVRHLLQTPQFINGEMYTGMIDAQREQWQDALREQQDALLLLAAASILQQHPAAGFRLNAAAETQLSCTAADSIYHLTLQRTATDTYTTHLQRDDQPARPVTLQQVHSEPQGGDTFIRAVIDNTPWQAHCTTHSGISQVRANGMTLTLSPLSATAAKNTAAKSATAPMNAIVTAINVKAGDSVEKNAPLLMLEAMKMELVVTAPHAGVVETIYCQQGDRVTAGTLLVALREEEAA